MTWPWSPPGACQNLSQRLKNRVLLKREDQQPVFSFKRGGVQQDGAPDACAAGTRRDLRVAGNHAQGVALSAKLGCARRDRDAHHHPAGQD